MMHPDPHEHMDSRSGEILASLEPDQLIRARQHFARRRLKGREVFLVWSLRIYLLFMLGVVIYQMWKL